MKPLNSVISIDLYYYISKDYIVIIYDRVFMFFFLAIKKISKKK